MNSKAMAEGRKWNGYLCYEAVWGRGLCGLVSIPCTSYDSLTRAGEVMGEGGVEEGEGVRGC